jgi:ASC-1-like (ASCH) protein
MFILMAGDERAGIVHIVGKRQGTYKISPLVVAPEFRGKLGVGTALLTFSERYARERGARQMYCTVAEENIAALQFFIRRGYIPAGRSASHYKSGITEVMLYKLFVSPEAEEQFDRPNISVLPFEQAQEEQVRRLLFDTLPHLFRGIDTAWINALFDGYERRHLLDVNLKYKLIYVAVDRDNTVLGVVGATPKKGKPIKLMPFIATILPAFVALLADVPFALRAFGRKLYIHIVPSAEETIALQQRGWRLDAAMPEAYHSNVVTQQWSLDIDSEDFMRQMRVKQSFLDQIKQRKKTLEVRVAYSSIQTIERGERVKMTSRSDAEIVRVKDVRRYPNFDEMLRVENADSIAPGKSRQYVLQLLREIYPQDREKLGIVVLDIEPDTSASLG